MRRGEGGEGAKWGKNGTLATEHTYLACRWSPFKPKGGEGGEARWGSFWNGDGTHWQGEVRELQRIFMGSGLGFWRGTLFSGGKGKWELKELGISAGRRQRLLTWWSVGGPTKRLKYLSYVEWKQCPNAREWKLGNFEWWVMKTEWWKLSDKKVLTKQGLKFLSHPEVFEFMFVWLSHLCYSFSLFLLFVWRFFSSL